MYSIDRTEYGISVDLEGNVTAEEMRGLEGLSEVARELLDEDVGIAGERVIDATDVDDWESQALDWINDGIEPNG